jgi:hypothetical protein
MRTSRSTAKNLGAPLRAIRTHGLTAVRFTRCVAITSYHSAHVSFEVPLAYTHTITVLFDASTCPPHTRADAASRHTVTAKAHTTRDIEERVVRLVPKSCSATLLSRVGVFRDELVGSSIGCVEVQINPEGVSLSTERLSLRKARYYILPQGRLHGRLWVYLKPSVHEAPGRTYRAVCAVITEKAFNGYY